MKRNLFVSLGCGLWFVLTPLGALSEEAPTDTRILAIVQRMESTFKTLEDYTCEVDQIFYLNGVEEERNRFKFFFKKPKKIRVDFSSPYPSLTLVYLGGEPEVTVIPFRFFSALKFRFSVTDPKIRTRAGQRIPQTDMGYFIEFLFRNLETVKQGDGSYGEDGEKVRFVLRAMDYIEGKMLETYQITISKRVWLPVHIERYSLEGKRLEVTDIRNYVVDSHLQDALFRP